MNLIHFFKRGQLILLPISFVLLLFASIYCLKQLSYSSQSILEIIEHPFFLEIFVIPTFLVYFSLSVKKLYNDYVEVRLIGIKKIHYMMKQSFPYVSLFILVYVSSIGIGYVFQNHLVFNISSNMNRSNFSFVLLNQFLFFSLAALVLFKFANKYTTLSFLLIFIPVMDYFLFFSKLALFLGIISGPNLQLYFLRNALVASFIFLYSITSNYGLLKREFLLRIRYLKLFFGMLLCLVIVLLANIYRENILIGFSFYVNNFLMGVSSSNVQEIYNGDFFLIPFMWIVLQLMYVFMLSSCRYDDFYKSGVYVLIRCGFTKFNRIKNFSLFLLTILFIFLFYLFPIAMYQQIQPENSRLFDSDLIFIFYLIVVFIHTFSLGLLYEYGSILYTPRLSVVVTCMIIITSIFTTRLPFVNLSMLAHWISKDYTYSTISLSLIIVTLLIGLMISYSKRLFR
ncbi:hypothetical protein CKN99_11540 [Carnobacterium maltaromaticum]|nr:hypothetical protein CKN90_11495 [Carnobacterium maltaromaticum]TFJ30752.1 hypothetical protein CKN98_11505 [Carnobacterium maltaromaticum]TFJ31352.1 hypothetical protein CKN88_16495 [Carnobacterium maltaromaticum]TFJ36722.1 hypothetical protein CKN99_11540 [Carnobacterium maltaromaticum]TFJ43918.1 hypothetical protein CKN92_10975 [Carnobacterium maltaromaticum]